MNLCSVFTWLVVVVWKVKSDDQANYVYHLRDVNNNNLEDTHFSDPFIPVVGQNVTIRWKVEYQFYTDTHGVWYTIDGTRPDGGCNVPTPNVTPGTLFVFGHFEFTRNDNGIVDIIQATIPTADLPFNTTVRYAVGSWKVNTPSPCGIGAQIEFANGGYCSGCGGGIYLMIDPRLSVFSFQVACTAITNCVTLTGCVNNATSQCGECVDGYFINGVAEADTCQLCSEPPADSFTSSVCSNSGDDTEITACANAGTDDFVTAICVSGNSTTLGSQTETQACKTANSGDSYISGVCVPGSSTTLGSDSTRAGCSSPAADFYVVEVCAAGSPSILGNNTKTLPCSPSPPANSFVSSVCVSGDSSTLGQDTHFSVCSGSMSGSYVSGLCSPGTMDLAGTDTEFTLCSPPILGTTFVSTICAPGSVSALGMDTSLVTCSPVVDGYFAFFVCDPGTPSSPGHDTTQQRCSTAGLGQIVIQECIPGNTTTPGRDAVISDVNACTSFPCGSFATCTDLPAPALNATSGRNCTCDVGYVPIVGTSGACSAPVSSSPRAFSSSSVSTGSQQGGAVSSTADGGGNDAASSTDNTPIIAGVAAGGGFLILLVVIVCVCRSRRRSGSLFKKQNMLVRGRIQSEMSTQPNYVDSETLQTPVELGPTNTADATSSAAKIEII